MSLCPDGKREQRPSCSAWSPWCQLWSISQGKAHPDILLSTQITAAVFKLYFHHLCPGFTHSRNVMFVRKIGCYLTDTATVSQGLPTMDTLPPPHWFSIQAQDRLTSAWVIRDIILTVHRTLGTEMNKEYVVRGEDGDFTLGPRENSLRVEKPVGITWCLYLFCFRERIWESWMKRPLLELCRLRTPRPATVCHWKLSEPRVVSKEPGTDLKGALCVQRPLSFNIKKTSRQDGVMLNQHTDPGFLHVASKASLFIFRTH